jgi:hypothetical protein
VFEGISDSLFFEYALRFLFAASFLSIRLAPSDHGAAGDHAVLLGRDALWGWSGS